MARPKPKTTFTYAEIAKTVGLSEIALYKAIQRGNVDPQDLKSLCFFIVSNILATKAGGKTA